MIYKRNGHLSFLIFAFVFHLAFVNVSAQLNTTASNSTSTEVTESANNALWLIVGVICAVVLVLAIIAVAGIAYATHRSKRIHPHSDTETIYTESESGTYTRPTTASHIKLEQEEEEEAMSKPVTMTPFELRKLYIETFPYRNWRRGYDGSLRPKMSLKFVDPRIYSKSKGDERHFREKIYNYENSDTLTLRSSALSRMMHHTRMPTMSEMDVLPEGHFPPIDHELEYEQDQIQQQCYEHLHDKEQNHVSYKERLPNREHNHVSYQERLQNQEKGRARQGPSSEPEFERVCMRSDDVELM
ncbi:uncharacterized protein LOC132738593 [Ruditapes philippinarum]|uniref:uncharacterized protein LOC132738593 n=1 Tax=Ruditapes philippinarum TaxID=129788 RepID=UPI00295B14CA|nr:uncharacterized protein LOC132738593 [Ruditapes philippinarum]